MRNTIRLKRIKNTIKKFYGSLERQEQIMIIAFGIINIFLFWYAWQHYNPSYENKLDNLASVFGEEDHKEILSTESFFSALENKSFTFLAENITPSPQRESLIDILENSLPLMDIITKETNDFLFFSFAYTDYQSSILHNTYGYINKESGILNLNPNLTSQALSETIYYNTSKFPLFLSGEILSVPEDKSLLPNRETIDPQEKFILTAEEGNELISKFESIDSGFIVSIER